MRAFINSTGNANFVNLDVADIEKALAHAKTQNHNQISIPVFIRTGAGADNLHSVQGIGEALGKPKAAFLTSGDIATRQYTPKQSTVVDDK